MTVIIYEIINGLKYKAHQALDLTSHVEEELGYAEEAVQEWGHVGQDLVSYVEQEMESYAGQGMESCYG